MRQVLVSAGTLLSACFVAAAALAQPVPLGFEFQVNTYTPGPQGQVAAAMDADGDFVVVWNGQAGSAYGIFAQRFDSSGAAQAVELQVNSGAPADQELPSVAMNASGDFVVAWQSENQDGDDFGVFARRVSSAGVLLGSEFQVNTYTVGEQAEPSVAADDDGDFVVVWLAGLHGLLAQLFDSTGTPRGEEFQVRAVIAEPLSPSAAMDSAGNFVIAYEHGSLHDIFARRFDASGNAQAVEFQVNTYTPYYQREPFAAMDGAGNFVVAWSSPNQDGESVGIFARRFDAAGNPQAVEFQVNSYTPYTQASAAVDFDGSGDFVIVWHSRTNYNATGQIFAQRFDATGVAQGIEFLVNSYTTGIHLTPSVAVESDGDFVVSWQDGFFTDGQDGSRTGVFAQRFAAPVTPPIVSVDIKPGAFPNNINVHSSALVKVAILTTSVADGDPIDFDAWDVDPFSVVFGPSGASSVRPALAEDVDFDGDLDMVLAFRANATGIPCGATTATLNGETFGGDAIEGTDSLNTVGGSC